MWISLVTIQPELIISLGFLIISLQSIVVVADAVVYPSINFRAWHDFEEDFSYEETDFNGPSYWYKKYPACGGHAQSPINIETNSVKTGTAPQLQMKYFNKKVVALNVTNNGQSVIFRPTFSDSSAPNKSLYWNGALGKVYIFDSLHFHWGNYCGGGSEHTIDGHRYAAEVHLVHYNEKYKHFSAAASKSDGLAIVSVLFELAEEVNNDGSNNNKFIKFLNYVRHKGQSHLINDINGLFNIKQLIKNEVKDYYSYKGSLTAPPCYESVRWIISKRTVKIYPSEIAKLQKILKVDGHPLLNNHRPLQDINGRNIYDYNYA